MHFLWSRKLTSACATQNSKCSRCAFGTNSSKQFFLSFFLFFFCCVPFCFCVFIPFPFSCITFFFFAVSSLSFYLLFFLIFVLSLILILFFLFVCLFVCCLFSSNLQCTFFMLPSLCLGKQMFWNLNYVATFYFRKELQALRSRTVKQLVNVYFMQLLLLI